MKKTPNLLWPATPKGEAEPEYTLIRKDFLAQELKKYTKKFKGVDFTAKHLGELLSIVEKGEEPAELPAEYQEIFNDFTQVYKLAKEKQSEARGEKEKEENHELSVLNTALDETIDIDALNSKFTVSATGVEIHEDATDEDIAAKLRRQLDLNEFSSWAIGDLGNALIARGLEDVVVQICAKTGHKESTVYSKMSVARIVPIEKRNVKLLPTTIAEIVLPKLSDNPKKDAALKEKLLAEAEKEGWSSKEARSAADEARTTKKQKKGNKKKLQFLVVRDGSPTLVADEPGFEEGVLVVDLKDLTFLGDVPKEGDPETMVVDWKAIPEA